MSIMRKTQENIVIERIISVLHKYRIIAIVYVVLQLSSFVTSIFQSHLVLHFILSALELLLPVGITLAIFFNSKNKIKFIKYTFIAGFAGLLINAANSLFVQIYIISSKTFINYDLIPKFSTYLNGVHAILSISIAISFLLILISNVASQKMGILVCTLIIISMVLSVIGYISFFVTINIKDFIQIPVEFRSQVIINWIKEGIAILSWGTWMITELLIIQGLLNSKSSTNDNVQSKV